MKLTPWNFVTKNYSSNWLASDYLGVWAKGPPQPPPSLVAMQFFVTPFIIIIPNWSLNKLNHEESRLSLSLLLTLLCTSCRGSSKAKSPFGKSNFILPLPTGPMSARWEQLPWLWVTCCGYNGLFLLSSVPLYFLVQDFTLRFNAFHIERLDTLKALVVTGCFLLPPWPFSPGPFSL